jgi:demethylmenaquinone methyltransferase/2-methoxy-6-polyprenyl-1,4-benzoquinol methylase
MKRYDITSKLYDERYGEEQRRKYCRALQNVDVKDMIVLDLGCGSGLFFSEIAGKAETVIGVDVSLNLLQKAKEKAKNYRGVSVLRADADHLPLRNESFDRVFAYTVLQNIPKPKATLKEVRRVSKYKGKIVVTGLKKAFLLDAFMDIIEESELNLISFVDDEPINCYIAVLSA